MIFHCTLVPCTLAPSTLLSSTLVQGAPRSASTPDGQLIELSVEVPERCPGAKVEAAIALRYGTGGLSVRGEPLAAMTVGEPPLVQGAVLVESAVLGDRNVLVERAASANSSGAPSRPGPGQPEASTLLLAVDSGPGAGTLVALRRGQFRIGRSGTEIVIPDAALSRVHARLDVSDSNVTIMDLVSANGTSVDGRKVRLVPVTTGSSIRCGDSTISLRLGPPVPNGAAESVMALAGSSVAAPLVVRGTAASSHRAAVALAAVLPLLAGVGLALLTGMWMFLAFTAVSGVSVLVPYLAGRRQRRGLNAAVAEAALQDRERRRQPRLPRRTWPSVARPGHARRPAHPMKRQRRSACGSGWRTRGRISGWNHRTLASGHPRSARSP